MPPVVAAIATFLTWFGVSAGVAATLAPMILSMGASLVLGEVAKLFMKGPDQSSLTSEHGSRTVTSRQAVAPWKIAYGKNRLGGVVTFLGTTGTNNEFLQMVITLTGHEVNAIPTMYFDGVAVPLDGSGNATGNFAGLVHVEFNLGTRDQVAFAGLMAATTAWTSAHRQRGCAGVYVQLKWDQNKFPNGVPNITFDVNGRKVYDPRSGAIAYSNNAALCIADYLSNARFGLGAQTKAALTGSMVTQSGMGGFNAANCVDGDVSTAGWHTDTAVSGSTLQVDLGAGASGEYVRCRIYANANLYPGIYDIERSDDASVWTAAATGFKPNVIGWNEVELAPNGAHRYWRLKLTNTPGTGGNLNELEFWSSDVDSTQTISAANTCDEAVSLLAGGTENRYMIDGSFSSAEKPSDVISRMNSAMAGSVLYVAGKWGIYPGIWRAATISLTDADLRGPLKVQTRMPHRDLYNGVKGVFISPTNNWQIADFPPFSETNWLKEDGNERLWLDVEYPFTISGATAQRLSKIALRRGRKQITVQGQFKLSAYQVQPLDVVQLSHPRFGWTNKTFEVAACTLIYGAEAHGSGKAGGGLAGNLEPQELVVGVDLSLRETDSTVYDWSTADENSLAAPPTSSWPNPAVCQPPTSLLLSTNEIVRVADGVRVTQIVVNWTAPADQFVTAGGHIIVQYKKSADSLWTQNNKLDGAVVQDTILPVIDGTGYDVRIWAENSSGVKSGIVSSSITATGAASSLGGLLGGGLQPDLPYNGSFEIFAGVGNVADGWTKDFETIGAGGTYGQNSSTPYAGSYAQTIANGASDGAAIASRHFGVKPNVRYTFRVRMKATTVNTGKFYFRVLWYTSDADLSKAGAASQNDIIAAQTSNPATWTAYSGDVVAPANAVFCRIALYNWSGTAGTLHFDTCSVQVEQRGGTHSSYRPTSNPLAAHCEVSGFITINIAGFTMRVGATDVAINSGALSNYLALTLYYIFYDDPQFAGGAVTYQATTVKEDVLNAPGRFFVGSILTPPSISGTPDTIGNSDGGSGVQAGVVTQFFFPTDTDNPTGGANATATNTANLVDAKVDTFATYTGANGFTGQQYTSTLTGLLSFQNRRWNKVQVCVQYEVTANSMASGGSAVFHVQYSSDGGATWGTFSSIGANETRTLAVTRFDVPITTVLKNFQVRVRLNPVALSLGSGSVTVKVYESWLECTE